MLEVAKGIQKTAEFQSLLDKAADTQTNLRNKLDKTAKNLLLLQRTRNEMTSSFKDIRMSFNQFMDSVEEESITEMDMLLSFLQQKVKSDTDICLHYEKEIQKFLDDIKKVGNKCNEFAFQCFKRCARKLSSAKELLSSMENEDYQLKFIPDAGIQKFKSSLKLFGKFDIIPANLAPDYPYRIGKTQSHNVRTKEDKKICSIYGISQLPDRQVATVDYRSNKVHLMSSSVFSVISELALPPSPQDICTITGSELAVSVCAYKRNELHFINAAGGYLTHTRTQQLDHTCFAVACNNGQLYVGSEQAIYEYSLTGQKLKKIYENTSSEGMTVFRFAVSDDGNKIYVTNQSKNCLVTVNKSGYVLSELSGPELKHPCGVCVAGNGNVFVCGKKSKAVIQVDCEGKKKIATLVMLPFSDDNCFPLCLCFDRQIKELLLGQVKDSSVPGQLWSGYFNLAFLPFNYVQDLQDEQRTIQFRNGNLLVFKLK